MNNEKTNLRVDAVIVLANLMDSSGVLNLESSARAEKSVEIYNQLQAKNLVTCGWAYRDDSNITIAEAFKNHIITRYGIPSERIIAEKNSRDTVGDAYFTKTTLALPKAWRKIYVVTSDYHVERTKEIFKFIYGNDFSIDVIGVELTANELTLRNELKSLEAFRNTFKGVQEGNDLQIFARLKRQHPFYNGKIYTKI